MLALLITPPHIVLLITSASVLFVSISTGKVLVMSWFFLARTSSGMVFGVVIDVDTTGPAILVKLFELEEFAVASHKGVSVGITMG